MKKVMRSLPATLMLFLSLSASLVLAQEACDGVLLEDEVPVVLTEKQVEARPRLPDEIEDLKIIFPHQERLFKEKNREYLAFEAKESAMKDPIYKRFQEDSIELILSSGSGFRHLLLRAGEKVYDFGNLMSGRAGVPFQRPSEKPDYKGVVFMVGRERIKEAEQALMAFYSGNVKFNNPPYSSVGGKLVIHENGGQLRFESKEKVWIPGNKQINIDNMRNNLPFEGRFVEEELPDGRKKTFLENPLGARLPVVMSENGDRSVNGLSCASSAVYVMKHIMGIELFDSVSAANLVKKLLEGNNGLEATPDALVIYGPERKQPATPLLAATGDRGAIRSKDKPVVVVAAPAPVAPVAVPGHEEAPEDVTIAQADHPAEPVISAPTHGNSRFVAPPPPEQPAKKRTWWRKVWSFVRGRGWS